jgi:nitrogen regulatory protein PII 1
MAIKDSDKDFVLTTIIEAARTDEHGAFGDGKIFVTPIVETYTISNGLKE